MRIYDVRCVYNVWRGIGEYMMAICEGSLRIKNYNFISNFTTKSSTKLIYKNYRVGQIFLKTQCKFSLMFCNFLKILMNIRCVFLELQNFKEKCPVSFIKFDHCFNFCDTWAWRKILKKFTLIPHNN